MASFTETDAKKAIRSLLLRAAEALGRSDLCFMGLPAEKALDVKVMKALLGSVICIGPNQETLDEAARSISTIPLKRITLYRGDAWDFLRDEYPPDNQLADVTFLDFYGGGFREEPFLKEIAALQNYFLRHALVPNRAFVFAWTYMPRDAGPSVYEEAIRHDRLDQRHLERLRQLHGLPKKSYIIRLVLATLLDKYGFSANIYQHVVYKNVMNALIVVFSKGPDSQCSIPLVKPTPDALVAVPVVPYTEAGIAPPRQLWGAT